MKFRFSEKYLIALAVVLCSGNFVVAQHAHLNAGATGTQQNDPLIFANGSDFAADSGYVKTLYYTNAGPYAGYFQQNITLTALPATPAHAGPDPDAPALGSFIQASMSCLEGPAGGSFAFWAEGATTPTISLQVGQTSPLLWKLTEADGSPGTDPYGHIHGRRFTATVSGFYKIGFTLFDTSTNGAGGGPIHKPSAELAVLFEAGVNIRFIEPDEDHTHVNFAAPVGASWQVETSRSLSAGAQWTPVGRPVEGDDYFHEVENDDPVEGQRYYRLIGTTP